MPQELKRRQRDDDDVEAQEHTKHRHVRSDDSAPSVLTISESTSQEQQQKLDTVASTSVVAIPQLRFATESWQGMKPNNEDRHVTDTTRFPGPVFGVFDGHGGVFTVEFLVRHLLKNMSASLKQHVHAKEMDALATLRVESEKEAQRKHEIETQLQLFQEQLVQVQQIMLDDGASVVSEETAAPATTAEVQSEERGEDSEEKALYDQLHGAVSAMQDTIKHIDSEEAQRREQFRAWVHKQDPHFKRAFCESFQKTDAQVVQKNPSRDGSTALLIWFVGNYSSSISSGSSSPELVYYTINLGDCRAVLCRGGHGIPLTTDHKPSRPDEKQRILNAGGFVGTFSGISRVYSATGAGLSVQQQPESSTYLAVSRAFGDRPLKVPSALVSCEPEVKRFSVEHEDLFIVVACDGIWDVMSNQEAVNIGLTHFSDAQRAADAIVKEAYKRGSSDNLTATVIQFGWQDGTPHLKQAQANNSSTSDSKAQQQHKPSPRFLQQSGLVNSRMASILDSDAAIAAAAGETTENQEDEDEDEEEIDMFNL